MLKKLIVVALAGFGGYFAYKQTKAKSEKAKADQDLWAEAVDRVDPGH